MGKSRSLLLAGLAAGAYAYFRKKENRDKAMEAFNSTKDKVNSYMESQKQTKNSGVDNSWNPDSNNQQAGGMDNEESIASANYYNDIQADEYLMNEEVVNESASESDKKVSEK